MAENNRQKPQPRRARARNEEGTYKGGNEAFVPTELEQAVGEKDVGKYDIKPKIRPSFGRITTDYH